MKRSRSDFLFDSLNALLMSVLVLLIAVPLLNVLSTSLVSSRELARNNFVIVPGQLDFGAYRVLLAGTNIVVHAYLVTLFRTVVGTGLNMLFTYFVAYALSKKDLPARRAITLLYFFTMLFSGGLIPNYILIKNLGLMNSIWVYVIPNIVYAWYLLLLRNFIMNIPYSIFESLEMDGAGQLVTIFRFVLPLSLPALATLSLFYAVGHWNYWFDAFLFVSDPQKQPIQLMLRNILARASNQMTTMLARAASSGAQPPSRSLQSAAIVITTLPIVLLYPFLQRYFVKGVMAGSIKG
jgi:putative aldouronate transport system permease protein